MEAAALALAGQAIAAVIAWAKTKGVDTADLLATAASDAGVEVAAIATAEANARSAELASRR